MAEVGGEKKFARSDNVIPDYDYLFDDTAPAKKRGKTRVLGKFLRLNRRPITATLLLYILQFSPTFAVPLLSAEIINLVTYSLAGGGAGRHEWTLLAIYVAVIAVLILQNVPSTVWRRRIMSKMLRRTSAGIKSSVVRKLQQLSITYHKDIETGRIQSKFLKDTDSVDTLFSQVVDSLLPNILGVMVAVIISLYRSWVVSLFFLLVIPCNVLLSRVFRKRIGKSYRDYRLRTEDMSSRLTTMLEMIPVTKSHGLENIEIESVHRSIMNLTGSGRYMDETVAHFGAMSWVLNNILSALCLVFCAVLALLGRMPVGDIVLYQSLFSQISGYVSALINIAPQLASGNEALNSVSEIMNVSDVETNIGKKEVPAIEGAITFEHVSYRYPNTEQFVVRDFDLAVRPGECIAVVGPSGSGKSTIMNMIIGFLRPTEGALLVDGTPIGDYDLSGYRHHISVVPQNSILFSGTIRENITYGLSSYSEQQLAAAVEMANLEEFLHTLPDGLDTRIGEHGDKLSGGQKQRITIARALIRNPKILILDEATSALDNISEFHVQKAIASSIRGRTTFIVAHRLSTIRDADRIVVMDAGVAVEIGTYDELMAKKGKFYELKCLNDLNLKTAEEGLA